MTIKSEILVSFSNQYNYLKFTEIKIIIFCEITIHWLKRWILQTLNRIKLLVADFGIPNSRL